MLPSKNRLKLPVKWDRRYPDFQLRTDLFKIIVKKIEGESEPKFGFIITTKIGKASVRNRIKRKMVTFIAPFLKELGGGVEVVIIAHPALAKANDEEISANLNRVLSKIPF